MNKNISKMYLRRDRFFLLYLVIISVILSMLNEYSTKLVLPNNYSAKLIMFISTLKVLGSFGSKDFKMFIFLSCTRKKYYINKIKSSLINSLFLSIVCTILNFFGEEIHIIKYIIIIFSFYFIFYILLSSVEIFIEVLSISQYAAVKFGVLFFSFPLYVRFIIFGPIFFGDTEWILMNFIPYFSGSLALICFNMFMSTVALKTTEI
ncbi:hypothetical protein KQI86_02805 [Clostridium sp. MSJ-11]|uniref:Uncharacterized protein n=1 Tax=Clostridium mobile TaxID=2841512 RepID=A0ABS6EDG2_9CLOT|nr:hypothetical protein [Clostridium mobile]MBU5483241.1 hypothetical protein [Clostridium mobile]